MKTKHYLLALIAFNFFLSCGDNTAAVEKARADSLQMELVKQRTIDSMKKIIEVTETKKEPEQNTTQVQTTNENAEPITYDITGTWSVSMKCTESICEDIKVGDTKTETWSINLQNGDYVVKVLNSSGNSNSRYKGAMRNNELTLADDHTGLLSSAKILVTTTVKSDNYFTGTRDVLRSDPCSISYSITAKKQ